MISGYENFKESYEEVESFANKISRDGAKYGIYTIVTAISDRAMRLNMRSNFQTIIPLKLSAPIEYNMLLGKKVPTISDIANRGVVLIDDEPYEFQTATVASNEKLTDYLKAVITSLKEQMSEKARRIPVLPEKVTLNILRPFLKDLTSVPVGIIEESLDIATYNFKNSLINLVNSDDMNALANFTKLLIKEVSSLPNVSTLVIDLRDFYKEDTFTNIIYNNNTQEAFTIMLNEAFKENRTDHLIIFAIGFEKAYSILDSSVKNTLLDKFNQMAEMKNVSIVLVDRLIGIKPFAYDTWFKQLTATDRGIYIGRGLNNSTIHNLSTSFRTLNAPIEANFGFIITNGEAIKMKVLEGDL